MRKSQILALCLCLGSLLTTPEISSAQEVYEVTIAGAKILPTKASGKLWDLGCLFKRKMFRKLTQRLMAKTYTTPFWETAISTVGLKWSKGPTCMPDPFAMVKLAGKIILKTKKRKNTLSPTWEKSATLKLSRNSYLEIYVYDRDLRSHDLIGSHTITSLSKRHLMMGGVISLRFGRVYHLRLGIKPVSPVTPKQVIGSYQMDKATTLALMQHNLKRMSLQQRQRAITEIQSMKVSLKLTANLQMRMNIEARPGGQSIRRKIEGRWEIQGYKLLLQNKNSKGRRGNRCRYLYHRLICTWWNKPLVLRKKK